MALLTRAYQALPFSMPAQNVQAQCCCLESLGLGNGVECKGPCSYCAGSATAYDGTCSVLRDCQEDFS